ncbi:MAG: hypothetical protein RL318_2075, partial [Fibrobacterota bacterium]
MNNQSIGTRTRLRRAFAQSRLARLGLVILLCLYGCAAFADILAPYAADDESREHSWAAPTSIHLKDLDGWHAPFIYPVSYTFDENAQRVWQEDTSRKIPLKLWSKSAGTSFWGIVPLDHRLFGIDAASGARLYLLGADSRGRDLFSRILYGARISLTIGILGVSVTLFLAMLVGGIAGYFGGWTDSLLMRLCEVVMLVPGFYLMMLLRAVLPLEWSSILVYFAIVIILSFVGWAGLARVLRGMILSIANMDYVTASKALGVPAWKILVRHVLPQTFGYLAVTATLSIPSYIIAESGLSLLGLGIQDPQTSWGNLLSEAMSIAEI